jgi:hypothetical protein
MKRTAVLRAKIDVTRHSGMVRQDQTPE